MSVAGISSSLLNYTPQSVQNNFQQFQKEFQQLGQDLQSGNLSAAQSDFATLQKDEPQSSSSSASQNSPIAQAFSQLSKDLQSGNLSAAQQDYSSLQQDFQNQATQAHRHHHHGGGGESGNSSVSQLLSQLGQDLQSGNLTSAQQAYSTLAQDFQQSSSGGAQPQSPLIPLSGGVSFSA